jgi:hypothetical protein
MPDSPITVAEVAITLAGFSGLFFALQRRPNQIENIERFALYYLLLTSLGAAVLALLSMPLSRFTDASALWLCVISCIYILGLSIWRAWTIVRIAHGRYPWARRILGFLQWAIVAALLFSIADVIDRTAMYFLALWWLVFAAAIQFFLQVTYSFGSVRTDDT